MFPCSKIHKEEELKHSYLICPELCQDVYCNVFDVKKNGNFEPVCIFFKTNFILNVFLGHPVKRSCNVIFHLN